MKKISSKRKGALTIEFIIVVSILVLIAGIGTAWVLGVFNSATASANTNAGVNGTTVNN